MMSKKGLVAAVAMTVTLGCAAGDEPTQGEVDGKADGVCSEGMSLSLAQAFSSFVGNQPVVMVQDPQSHRWYVGQRGGVIATMPSDGSPRTVFADLRDRVNSIPDEAGLLGFALHPDFATNHEVFVSYTTGNLISRISRFSSPDGGLTLDPGSETILLQVAQPFENNNGGGIAFGPDGYLYIGFGDGGSAGDPMKNGENKTVLFGKILRIDVDGAAPYTIPSDNPFANGGGRKEIFAYGLRNPWRFSFDSSTNKLWVGDQGQDRYEEIDKITKGGNYGWSVREGRHCYRPATDCSTSGMTDPVFEYGHHAGGSVTGGYVYRGTKYNKLGGNYVFADSSGSLTAIPSSGDGTVRKITTSHHIKSFGQGASGELYALDYDSGKIFHVTGHSCGGDCDPGETSCGGSCVDTTSDEHHCGSCTNVCAANEICSASMCVPAPTRFGAVYPIIKDECTGCHDDTADLPMHTEQIAYDHLVDQPSTTMGGECGGKIRVKPGNTNDSLLWQKVALTHPCGDRMPIGSTLTQAQIDLIADWIHDGAKR